MTNQELARQINDLIELDVACIRAYSKAIPEIDTPELGDKMVRLLNDHIHRVRELGEHVRKLGEEPVHGLDSNLPHEHHSTIGATLETLKALEDIRSAERSAQLAYEVAAGWDDIPEDLHASLKRYREQEHRDLDFVDHALVSVRAAASLWGPPDEPPILHH